MEKLSKAGRLEAVEEARRLNVSNMTIWRDFKLFEEQVTVEISDVIVLRLELHVQDRVLREDVDGRGDDRVRDVEQPTEGSNLLKLIDLRDVVGKVVLLPVEHRVTRTPGCERD